MELFKNQLITTDPLNVDQIQAASDRMLEYVQAQEEKSLKLSKSDKKNTRESINVSF